jgi:hypothetical protein
MLSRRAFLLISGLALTPESTLLLPASAKKKTLELLSGPRLISRQDWPPPIAPSQIGITERGVCCFTDQYGRLALIDFRKSGKKGKSQPVQLLGKVSGLGKKVIDFAVSGNKGFALVTAESEGGENQLMLVGVNLANAPYIVSRTSLEKYSEVAAVTASGSLVCVAGTTLSGESNISVYLDNKAAKGSEPVMLSNIPTEQPVLQLSLQNRHLLALEGSKNSVLQCFNMADARAPEPRKSLQLKGDFAKLACFGDTALVAGSVEVEGKPSDHVSVKSIAVMPVPHIVSELSLDHLSSAADVAATKGRFMVLGDTEQDMTIVSMTCDKLGVLSRERDQDPPRLGARINEQYRIAMRERTAYIATGWAGLQVVSLTPSGWRTTYDYTVPRYAASGIASWKNWVVLAGSELRLYDISVPTQPTLVSTTSLTSTSKDIVGAGSYVLCLLKDQLTLRKMQTLKDVAASLKITGSTLCFDQVQQKVYVLQANAKQTTVTKIQAYSNSLVEESKYTLPGAFTQSCAHDGVLLVSNLSNASLYNVATNEAQLLGSHHFENLALRDGMVTKEYVLITAVDQSSKGYFLVLSAQDKDLKVLGSTDLPNDGRAIAASKGKAVVIGQKEGKDSAVVVDYTTNATPKLVAELASIEEAAAVTISDETAIVGGRGLEILSLG